MKSIFIIILLLFVLFQSSAQNLVPNPSFEDTVQCPWTDSGIGYGYAANWFQPTPGSSDLFHTCSWSVPQNFFGFQLANTGDAYAGLYTFYNDTNWTSYREYMSVRLIDSLLSGVNYYVSFYISRADSMHYASQVGLLLSDDSLNSGNWTNLNYTAQCETPTYVIDKTNWTKVECVYTANGGEKFLTIGNFRNDLNSDTTSTFDGGLDWNTDYIAAYYFIDDVCISTDSNICNVSVGIQEIISNPEKKLIRVIDIMGRVSEDKPNTLLIFFHSDGTTEKVFRVE